MGNHYIPQFYLRGFTESGTIWAHDKREKRSFRSQPRSVANETEMYAGDLEAYFTEEIEQPAQNALENVRSNRALSQSDRDALAHYIVALWKRVPAGRSRSMERLPGVAASVEKDLHTQIDSLAAADPGLSGLASERKALISQLVRKNVEQRSIDIWQQHLSSEATPKIIDAIASMNWQFLISREITYLTSDNPFFFFPFEGLGPASAEATIPFSSTTALWLNRDPRPKPLYASASTAFVKEVNRRTAFNATRFVFSSTNEAWMAKLIFKERYQLNRVNW
jgi:hypothetical protein